MTKKLILASAGAGKTHRIVSESVNHIDSGKKVLVVTYTENNQTELLNKYKELGGKNKDKFHVKGLFTFLLEDIIRPYQNCIFQGRIETIHFNDTNPHKKGKWHIKGRKEKKEGGAYNPLHYLTSCGKKAHTMYLSKLATRVIKESSGKPIARLEEIYDHIYFDEIQDLVGWDYCVLEAIAKSNNLSVICVGDFRQTIYQTSQATKQPLTTQQKIDTFQKMAFDCEQMSVSRRSVQDICDLADTIHNNDSYEKTQSLVVTVPDKFGDHIGIYAIKETDVVKYIKQYAPTLLRHSKSSGKQFSQNIINKINFGMSKGSGFDRVLILPTLKYIRYLTGNINTFDKDKTDGSKNKLYVAITRARYSVGFIIQDKIIDACSFPIWEENSPE